MVRDGGLSYGHMPLNLADLQGFMLGQQSDHLQAHVTAEGIERTAAARPGLVVRMLRVRSCCGIGADVWSGRPRPSRSCAAARAGAAKRRRS
jgi:hypothetical protein